MSEGIIKLVRDTWLRNIVFLIVISLGLLILKERYSLILGLLIGSIVAMFNFLLIAWNTEHIMDKEDSFVISFGFFYLLRIVLSAACIYIGIRFSAFNLLTVVLGLFSIRISMTLATFLEIGLSTRNRKKSE